MKRRKRKKKKTTDRIIWKAVTDKLSILLGKQTIVQRAANSLAFMESGSSSTLDPVLIKNNSGSNLQPHLLEYSIYSAHCLVSLVKLLYAFLIYSVLSTCPVHLILNNFINLLTYLMKISNYETPQV
jgi:hypothetical protein